MHLVLEILWTLAQAMYFWLEGIVLALLPASLAKRKDVAGEKVLITGAGSGLGRLLAQRFARLGSTLILWDVNAAGNEETARLVKKLGATAHAYTCDISQRNQVYDAAEKVKKDVGDVDILVNNAGIVTGKTFLNCPDQLMQKTMDVNTNAHFWTTKAFLPSMMTRDHGHIVTIASSAGSFGVVGLVDYCASKHGAVGFEESLRMEIARQGKNVHSTVVCPYFINTGMFDGVQTRFPSILNVLDADYAADKIMDAVLSNQVMLYMPRILYVLLIIKSVLPVKVSVLLYNFFGVDRMMDTFKGRQKSD